MIISILNNKGGVGKTSMTINLGAYLAQKKFSVLLIDFDAQCNLSLTTNAKGGVYSIDNFLKKDFSNFNAGLKQVGGLPLYVLEGSFNLKNLTFKREDLKQPLSILNKKFDFILLDCPPAPIADELITANEVAVVASDAVFIPVIADIYSMQGVNILIQSIQKIKQNSNPKLEILGIAFSLVYEKEQLFQSLYSRLKEQAPSIVFKSYIRKNVDIQKAAYEIKTIFEYNPSSIGATDYTELGKEFLKRVKIISNKNK